MTKHLSLVMTICCIGLYFCTAAAAHDCFKDPLEHRYHLKTVSCKTCHPNNKDRSIHNKLGIMFENALKGKDLTKKFNEAEAQGEEAKAACEKMMVEEFNKVIAEVEKEQLTLADMIKFGLINGMRLNDEGVANAEKALKAEAHAGQSESVRTAANK